MTIFFLVLTAGSFTAWAQEKEKPRLAELASGAAMPAYATDSVPGSFENLGLGASVHYSASPAYAVTTGIPILQLTYAAPVFSAQVGAAVGSGYLSVAPGLGLQIPSIRLRVGANTNFQFNSFQWNNARIFAHWESTEHWSFGLRTGIAVVSNLVDEITIGIGKSWGALQAVTELQADGTFGTFRLIPGLGVRLGFFEAALSGAVARSSNWTFYADRFKVSVAANIAGIVMTRLYYETPYNVGLSLGVML